ncbi:MGMT family protein [Candidatus Nomurabacteria bacterium]|nr:MGMT family protein [Candidatus Nomurabacteria bacterium]
MKSFSERVYAIVREIPAGSILTYSEVAQKAGSPRAARAVGSLMAKNTDISIPCHRVIRSDGNMGGYNQLQGTSKELLLKKEGYIR